MAVRAIVNGTIYTPDDLIEDGVVLIQDGIIQAVKPAPAPAMADIIDARGGVIVPGFIDVHIHGLLGHDSMGAGLRQVIPLLPRYGVTAFLPTTLTAPLEPILEALATMAAIIEDPPPGARPLGIHVEGPHLSPKRPGMANPALFQPPSWDQFQRFQAAARGHIRMITFAPEETDDGASLIRRLIDAAVVPVIGHSDATFEQVSSYVKAGLAHATHTYNAMRGFHHREPGTLGAVMYYDQIVGQLIADGHHVHPAAMALLFRLKGADRVCLISDAAPLAGLPPGEYTWGETDIIIDEGTSRLPNGTLAGAIVLMDTGLKNLVEKVGLPLREALIPATRVPADVLGVKKGRLEPGWDADIVILDQALGVQYTLVGGEVVYEVAGDAGGQIHSYLSRRLP